MIFLNLLLVINIFAADGHLKNRYQLSMPDVHSCALEMESYLNHAYPGYEEGDRVMAACVGKVPKHTEG